MCPGAVGRCPVASGKPSPFPGAAGYTPGLAGPRDLHTPSWELPAPGPWGGADRMPGQLDSPGQGAIWNATPPLLCCQPSPGPGPFTRLHVGSSARPPSLAQLRLLVTFAGQRLLFPPRVRGCVGGTSPTFTGWRGKRCPCSSWRPAAHLSSSRVSRQPRTQALAPGAQSPPHALLCVSMHTRETCKHMCMCMCVHACVRSLTSPSRALCCELDTDGETQPGPMSLSR